MKKLYFLTALLFAASHIFSQTLFTYGKDAVTKDEFLRAYNKNKTSASDKIQSYKDYLDLYVKFKLKVKAAKELHLDTVQQLQADIDGFRSQVEEGYMNDDKGVNELVNEALAREKKEIHTIHFYVPINEMMSTADSLKAVKLLEAASAALAKGRTDYVDLATELSAEYKMVLKAADMGYVTVFAVPYEYENIIYGLTPGSVSAPYRSKKAIHIFKDLDERKNSGKWKVAQILFVFPPDATEDVKARIKQKADSVYRLIVAGADFAEMAKKYSEDKNSYMSGGELAEFGTGKFDLPFEKTVYALDKDGQVSQPLLTTYGYHIIKRIKHTPYVDGDKDENYMFEIKQKVLADARNNKAKDKFLKNVLVTIGYKNNNLVKDADLYRYADSVIRNKKLATYPINKQILFSIAGKNYTGKDWLDYVNNYVQNNFQSESSKNLFTKFTNNTALEYYRKNLDKYNTDFKYQMQEFREGNMLFEIMERNVWSKAAGDSVGLKNYYDKNKTKYLWEESADVIIYNCSDVHVAEQAVNAIKAGKKWKVIAEESNATVQADSGRYEISQLPVTSKLNEGNLTSPEVGTDGAATFIQTIKIYPAKQQRSFEEARGLVINEYQNYLEEKWIDSLKKKYPVKVNETVLKTISQ